VKEEIDFYLVQKIVKNQQNKDEESMTLRFFKFHIFFTTNKIINNLSILLKKKHYYRCNDE